MHTQYRVELCSTLLQDMGTNSIVKIICKDFMTHVKYPLDPPLARET